MGHPSFLLRARNLLNHVLGCSDDGRCIEEVEPLGRAECFGGR